MLRQRIVNHFNDCNVCDNCRTCNSKRRQLVGPYAPALIPILFAGEFRDRINEVIRRVVEQAHGEDHPPSHPGSSAPSTAAAADGVSVIAGGLLATAGAGTGAGAADALVSRLQSLVHKASESNRLPRWLRRAIPHDAGPGASITVVAAFVAAIIVAVVVIASVASALTSGGSPTPEAGPGNGGAVVAAGGSPDTGSGGAASVSAGNCTYSAEDLAGKVTPPVTATSLAASLRQQAAACFGYPLSAASATCDDPTTANVEPGYIDYTCTYSLQASGPTSPAVPSSSGVRRASLTNGSWWSGYGP